VEYVSDVIDVGMIDQENVNAAERSYPRVSRAVNRSARRNEHSHPSWVFKEQGPVADAEFLGG
jgi:hypothetical protein